MFNKNTTISLVALLSLLVLCAAIAQVNAGLLWSSKSGCDVTTVDELDKLIEESTDNKLVSDKTRLALNELRELVSFDKNENICSLEKVEEIRRFNAEHLSKDDRLPKAAKNFFVAYGLQVSASCKRSMIFSIESVNERHLLNEDDYATIEPWTGAQSTLAEFMNEFTTSDLDNLVLPSDILRVSSGSDGGQQNQPVAIQVASGHPIKHLHNVCQQRFKPVYDQIVLPVISLINMGFNYKSKYLVRDESEDFTKNNVVRQWYRIVYICELLGSVDIFELKHQMQTGEDPQVVRLLTREEANKLRSAQAAAGDEGENLEDEHKSKIEQIVYHSDDRIKLHVDKILDPSDKRLIKMIGHFDETKTELQRIRSRMTKKVGRTLLQNIKKGKFSILGSSWFGKSSDKVALGNDEVARVLESHVQERQSDIERESCGKFCEFIIKFLFFSFLLGLPAIVIAGVIAG